MSPNPRNTIRLVMKSRKPAPPVAAHLAAVFYVSFSLSPLLCTLCINSCSMPLPLLVLPRLGLLRMSHQSVPAHGSITVPGHQPVQGQQDPLN